MLNLLASRNSIAAFGLLASTSLVLPACSTMESMTSGLGGDPYLSDSSDVCYADRRALAETEDHFARDLVAGALSGAAVGAATGAITGAVTGGDVKKGALYGAGAGLLAGLAGGYLVSLQKKQQEPTEMVRLAMADMEAESAAIDRTTIAFDSLIECRKRQAAQINRDLKTGAIDRTTAEQRMETVKQQYQEDLTKASEISAKVNERSNAFLQVNNTIAADNGRQQLEIQDRGPGQPPKVVKVERPATAMAIKTDQIKSMGGADVELLPQMEDRTETTVVSSITLKNKIQAKKAGAQTEINLSHGNVRSWFS